MKTLIDQSTTVSNTKDFKTDDKKTIKTMEVPYYAKLSFIYVSCGVALSIQINFNKFYSTVYDILNQPIYTSLVIDKNKFYSEQEHCEPNDYSFSQCPYVTQKSVSSGSVATSIR